MLLKLIEKPTISDRWKKYESLLLNDPVISTRLLEKSMGNVILRGLLRSARLFTEIDNRIFILYNIKRPKLKKRIINEANTYQFKIF